MKQKTFIYFVFPQSFKRRLSKLVLTACSSVPGGHTNPHHDGSVFGTLQSYVGEHTSVIVLRE